MVQLIVGINQQATDAIPACGNIQTQSPCRDYTAKLQDPVSNEPLKLRSHVQLMHVKKVCMMAEVSSQPLQGEGVGGDGGRQSAQHKTRAATMCKSRLT